MLTINKMVKFGLIKVHVVEMCPGIQVVEIKLKVKVVDLVIKDRLYLGIVCKRGDVARED